MNTRRIIPLLILVMIIVAIGVGGIAIFVLYNVSIDQQRERLIETAQSQARLIEAVARIDKEYDVGNYPSGAFELTLSQIREGHDNFKGFGKTGEFTLAEYDLETNEIIFLLNRRYDDLENPEPIPWESNLGQPMRRALSDQSGTVIGPDYRGETVLAAYEPIYINEDLILGIVAKIDLSEIQAPFIRAGLQAGLAALVLILIGTMLFFAISNPMIQQIEESEKQYRELVNNLHAGVIVHAADTSIRFNNPQAHELLGLIEDQMLGKNSMDPAWHFTREDGTTMPLEEYPVNQVAASQKTLGDLVIGVNRPGTDGRVWVLVNAFPVFEKPGKLRQIIVTFVDITALKQAEEELKKYQEKLEELVVNRTKELEDAQEQLIRQEKLAILGQLSGGVGHELRNPLGVISNAIYFLQLTNTEADETTKEYLDIITSEVSNAEKIVSDLLDFARIKPVDAEEVTVSMLIDIALGRQSQPENVTVINHLDNNLPSVFVDRHQIGQILFNLVNNAYQAMPDGGELTISALVDNRQIKLSIADTGTGISEENKLKIFKPLFTTKARGIGLGLVVTKNLVEANGGSISVESTEGEGTIFTVALPMKEGETLS